MNRLYILSGAFLLLFVSTLQGQNRITVELQEFTELSVYGRADVEIIPSESNKMNITARNGRPEEVEYEIRNGELKKERKIDGK